jgi:prepilin signal peptidase PulO-like enzyme (type II secretory pathway)
LTGSLLLVSLLTGLAGGASTWLASNRIAPPQHRAELILAVTVPAILVPALVARNGVSGLVAPALSGFVLLLVAIALIDFRTHRIPLYLTIPGTLAGLALSERLLANGIAGAVAGTVFGAGVLGIATLIEAVRNHEIGGGDWKLAAMIGAFAGWPGILTALLLTGGVGLAGGIVLWWAGRNAAPGSDHRGPRGTPPPQALGPWLGAGAILSLLVR